MARALDEAENRRRTWVVRVSAGCGVMAVAALALLVAQWPRGDEPAEALFLPVPVAAQPLIPTAYCGLLPDGRATTWEAATQDQKWSWAQGDHGWMEGEAAVEGGRGFAVDGVIQEARARAISADWDGVLAVLSVARATVNAPIQAGATMVVHLARSNHVASSGDALTQRQASRLGPLERGRRLLLVLEPARGCPNEYVPIDQQQDPSRIEDGFQFVDAITRAQAPREPRAQVRAWITATGSKQTRVRLAACLHLAGLVSDNSGSFGRPTLEEVLLDGELPRDLQQDALRCPALAAALEHSPCADRLSHAVMAAVLSRTRESAADHDVDLLLPMVSTRMTWCRPEDLKSLDGFRGDVALAAKLSRLEAPDGGPMREAESVRQYLAR